MKYIEAQVSNIFPLRSSNNFSFHIRCLNGIGSSAYSIKNSIFWSIKPPWLVGGHYFHTWCPSVRKTKIRYYKTKTKQNSLATLHVTWWITKFARLAIFFLHFTEILLCMTSIFIFLERGEEKAIARGLPETPTSIPRCHDRQRCGPTSFLSLCGFQILGTWISLPKGDASTGSGVMKAPQNVMTYEIKRLLKPDHNVIFRNPQLQLKLAKNVNFKFQISLDCYYDFYRKFCMNRGNCPPLKLPFEGITQISRSIRTGCLVAAASGRCLTMATAAPTSSLARTLYSSTCHQNIHQNKLWVWYTQVLSLSNLIKTFNGIRRSHLIRLSLCLRTIFL